MATLIPTADDFPRDRRENPRGIASRPKERQDTARESRRWKWYRYVAFAPLPPAASTFRDSSGRVIPFGLSPPGMKEASRGIRNVIRPKEATRYNGFPVGSPWMVPSDNSRP